MRRAAGVLVVVFVASFARIAPAASLPTTVTRTSGPFKYLITSGPAPSGDFSQNVSCPAGFTLTGGGAAVGGKITDPDDNSHITTSDPSGLTTWETDGYNRLTAGAHTAVGAAVCISSAVPITLSPTLATSAAGENIPVNLTNVCATGSEPVSGGLNLGTPTISEFITASLPVERKAWIVEGLNQSVTTRAISAGLICASGTAVAIRYRLRSKILQPSANKTLTVSCPHRFRVAAGGFSAGGDFNLVRSSLPFDGRDHDRAPDDGWRITVTNQEAAPEAATVYAVCMRVR